MKARRILSAALALAMAAAMAIPCSAAGTNANISSTTYLNGVAVNGGINIGNYTFGGADNVVKSTNTILSDVVAKGDINITDVATLFGRNNVTDINQTYIGNTVSGGSISINELQEILGRNTTFGSATTINGVVAEGLDINTVLSTYGTYDNLNAAIQNVVNNAYFDKGGININTITD